MDILGILQSVANDVGKQLGSAISSLIGYVGNSAEQYVIKPLTSDISNALGSIGSTLAQLEQNASQGIGGVLSTVGNTLSNMESQVSNGFNSAMSSVGSAISTLENDIVAGFSAIVHGVQSTVNALGDMVATGFKDLAGVIVSGLDTMAVHIVAGVKDIFAPVASFIEGLPADIEKIAKAAGEEIEKVAKGTSDIAAAAVAWVDHTVKAAENDIARVTDPKTWSNELNPFAKMVDGVLAEATGLDITKLDPIALGRLAAGFAAEFAISAAVPFDEGLAFMLGNQLPALLDTAMAGSWRDIRQMANAGVPNELLSPGELVTGRVRGNIDDAYYFDQMERHGISDANATVIYENAQTMLNTSELIELWYRGSYKSKEDLYNDAAQIRTSKDQIDKLLELRQSLLGLSEAVTLWRRDIMPEGFKDYFDDARKAGMTQARIDAVKQSSYHLPSIYDVQEFVRRKVDDEAYVQKYGLDFGINEEYYTNAKANGFDRDTAKKLYRRYWSIPPFFITEGLYRTGKLDATTFKDLLIMEGYTPYWADQFLKQLQPTLTVGDIKDLYKYQVITADQIPEHLSTIGINGPLAVQYQELWKASVKLASPLDQTSSQANAATVKGETEGLLKTAYEDGVINKSELSTQLLALGKSQEAVTLITEIADYTILQKKLKTTFALVKDEYLSGAIAMADALQTLITTGASNDQVTLYQDELQKAGRSKPKTPTLAEFGAWYKKGIIDITQLSQGISLLGYSDTWVPFFLLYFGATDADLAALGYTTAVPVLA